MKKVISLFLSLVLVFSLATPALATSQENREVVGQDILFNNESYTTAKQIFENLDSNQKACFIEQIEFLAKMGDRRLVEFHKKYVDPDYQYGLERYSSSYLQPSAQSNSESVAEQLQELDLPTPVYYGLIALSTALAVPVGNVVDLVISLGLTALVVTHWDAIKDVWQEIVDIFVDAFGSAIIDGFNYLYAAVKGVTLIEEGEELPNQGKVSDDDYLDGPAVDAGKQGKHVQGHNNELEGRSKWHEGENGVKETQEAWEKGTTVKDTDDEEVRTYDFGRKVGANGQTRVKVHLRKADNTIHGYPVD